MAINYLLKKVTRSAFISIFFLFLIFLFTGPSFAQEKQEQASKQEDVKDEIDLKKKKKDLKIFLDKIEILGRIEKPQTLFIIPGTDPTVDDIQIDRAFFKEIFRSVEKDNFPKLKNPERKNPILW